MGILLFVAAIIGIVACIVAFKSDYKLAAVGCLVLGIAFAVVSCVASVPTGYTGIVTTFGRVHDETLSAGFHVKAPWDSVVTMDNREQRYSYTIQAFSSDIQEVDIQCSVNIRINEDTAMTLYRDVGENYVQTLVYPRVLESTKIVFSRYTAEHLVENRDRLSTEIIAILTEDLTQYGVDVMSVSIEDIDFSDAFTNAVEAKQVATQERQRAQTEQEQQTMVAQQEATRREIAANAEAAEARIQADADAYTTTTRAEAEAEANRRIAESLTEDLLRYTEIARWNGELPMYFYGGTSTPLPIINMD
jgi:regulator of protease activity HflC (stomatin/prohibitin superfamily)